VTPRNKEDVLADLERIAALPPNWDGYGGKIFETDFVNRVRDLIEKLAKMHVVFGKLVPGAGGNSVQFEWHENGRIVELEITTAWTLCWLRGPQAGGECSEGMYLDWDAADCWCVLRAEFPEFAKTSDERMREELDEAERRFPGFRQFAARAARGLPATMRLPLDDAKQITRIYEIGTLATCLPSPGVIAAIQESQINLSREGNPDPRIVTEDDGDPD